MLKAKRFMIEFANYKIGEYWKLSKENPQAEKQCYEAINYISRAIKCYERSFMTIDETIRTISNINLDDFATDV